MNNNYQFGKYTNIDRWSSYFHQINEVLSAQPSSVLEIGVGDGVLANYLKEHYADRIKVVTLDFNYELKPDIIGDVKHLPQADGSFDLTCAFEVLEHLPFTEFPLALNELRRVAAKTVIISLPHWGRHFSLQIRLPYFGQLSWQYKFDQLAIAHKFDGEHYWEIGKKDYPLCRIKQEIEKCGFKIIDDFITIESPYHHFFILHKI